MAKVRASAKPRKRAKTEESDRGTPEYRRKLRVNGFAVDSYTAEGKRQIRTRVQVPIDYYYFSLGVITDRQYAAANRLYTDFASSDIMRSPTVTMQPPQTRNAGADYTTANQASARKRVRVARENISGKVGLFLVDNVCMYGFFLKDLNVQYYGNPDQKMARFREALDELAKHYGLPSEGNIELV